MLVSLGFVRSAHGIRGTLKCAYITDRPGTLPGYEFVVLTDETTGEGARFDIEEVSLRKDDFLLKLAGLDDRNIADRFRNWYVDVPLECVPPRDKDEYFVWQLEGLKALSSGGAALGVVEEFVDTPGNPLLRICGEGGELFVVFCAEHVLEVDIEGGKLIVADFAAGDAAERGD